jgi:Ca2+-binding EF-hand superfamily protein
MKIVKCMSWGFVCLAAASVSARAQQAEPDAGGMPRPAAAAIDEFQGLGRMVFKLADTNNDGQISQQEAINAANMVVGGYFFKADKNGDGIVSQDEARQAREEFLSEKPWLRYVIETAQASRKADRAAQPVAGQPAATTGHQNPLATLLMSFDTNNDKQLQAGEVRQAVQTVVQAAFATADTNRDNQLSPSEVNAALAGAARTMARAAFQQADTDHNGQISQAEWEKAIIEPARVAFRVLDLNHDGQISEQEAQTARQVVESRLRMLNVPEPSNSPRHMINSALGSQTQPAPAASAPAPTPEPVPAPPAVPPSTPLPPPGGAR